MTFNRLFVLAAGYGLSLLIACGGNDGGGTGNTTPDAMIIPSGSHYGYVVSELSLPTSETQYAFDLGGVKSNKTDNKVDNALATLIGVIELATKSSLQPLVTGAVDKGQIVLLADLQAADLTNAAAAGFSVKLGVTASAATGAPVPPACTDTADTTCRHHLDGTGTFTIDQASPTNATVAGSIINGTFNGGPGNLPLQLALSGADPISLNLIGARVKATSITATGMTAIVGGLVIPSEIVGAIVPLVAAQLTPLLESDCGPESARPTAPPCGCTKDSAGESILNLVDKTGMASGTGPDCRVSAAEVQGLASLLLDPDVCTKEACTSPDGLSVGIQVKAVKATFPGLQ